MHQLVGFSGRLSQHFRQPQHREDRSCIATATKREVLLSSAAAVTSSISRPSLASEGASGSQQHGRHADGPPSTSGNAASRSPAKPLPAIPTVQLAEGLRVSQVIKGCWQLDGQHRGEPRSDHTSGAAAIEDLDTFLWSGVTTVDTADNYGQSEALIGQFVRLHPEHAQRLKVLTKLSFMLPAAEMEAGSMSKELLEYRVRGSLARMGIHHIDLLQLHWEDFKAHGWIDVMKHLVALQKSGLVRHVGVTNFDVPRLLRLLDAGIKPVSNQVAYSVIDRRPELYMRDFCGRHGIQLLPYGVNAGGFLADKYVDMPANQARLDTISKAKYGAIIKQLGGWSWLQDMLKVLQRIGKKHGVSVSNVAAKWVLQQRQVPAVILGARNTAHLRDHHRLFGFALDDIDLLDIDAAYESAKQPTSDCYSWERGGQW